MKLTAFATAFALAATALTANVAVGKTRFTNSQVLRIQAASEELSGETCENLQSIIFGGAIILGPGGYDVGTTKEDLVAAMGSDDPSVSKFATASIAAALAAQRNGCAFAAN